LPSDDVPPEREFQLLGTAVAIELSYELVTRRMAASMAMLVGVLTARDLANEKSWLASTVCLMARTDWTIDAGFSFGVGIDVIRLGT
jgi:hypothetical protein